MNVESMKNAALINRTRLIFRMVLVALLVFLIARLTSGDLSSRVSPGDFVEYWAGCRILLQGGNPYDAIALLPVERSVGWTADQALVPFNPPWAFLVVLPFSLLPFWLARVLWFLLNLIALIGIADWAWRIYGGRPHCRWVGWLCAILFVPAAISLNLGQMSPLVLVGVTGFLFALEREHGFMAGVSTVLVAIKPHVVPLFWIFLLLWVLKKRRWDVVSGAAVSFSFVLTVSLAINPSAYQSYLDILRAGTGPTIWQTPTWGVVLGLLLGVQNNWLYFLPAAIGIMAGIALWIRWHRDFAWEPRLPVILLISTMTAAYAWTFDWVVLLPVSVLILIRCQENRSHNLIFAGLVAVQGILIVQGIMQVSNLYSIWLPPALATLYWLSGRTAVSKERFG